MTFHPGSRGCLVVNNGNCVFCVKRRFRRGRGSGRQSFSAGTRRWRRYAGAASKSRRSCGLSSARPGAARSTVCLIRCVWRHTNTHPYHQEMNQTCWSSRCVRCRRSWRRSGRRGAGRPWPPPRSTTAQSWPSWRSTGTSCRSSSRSCSRRYAQDRSSSRLLQSDGGIGSSRDAVQLKHPPDVFAPSAVDGSEAAERLRRTREAERRAPRSSAAGRSADSV